MKKLVILFIFCTLFAVSGFSQSKGYWSSGGEMLFSFADISDGGVDEGSALRWAPIINLQGRYNYDLNQNLGIFTGLGLHNVGYIYDNYKNRTVETNELGNPHKQKFRSYNVGVPVGIKFGNMDDLFFYGGYEVEIPVLYKEKTFDAGGDKTNTTTGWFSDRQENFQHGFFAGVQFPYGFNVKFKYYVSEFHNQNYTESGGVKPYSGLESHVMYFSVGYNISWD
jgi:hypothetical protein